MFVYASGVRVATWLTAVMAQTHFSVSTKGVLPTRDRALRGRAERTAVAVKHAVTGRTTVEPFPEGTEMIMFGMGCFWGAERRLWNVPGVFSTQVGYAGGFTPNPTYQEVCSGLTGHAEVVRVVYSQKDVSLKTLLKVFWESHDPTQAPSTSRLNLGQTLSCFTTFSI
ncbi:mitochondrial peptide methionine sulfoxide reductase-like isoform X2 [Brachyhypopomus gauderio]|uniref:mitochondrial peptide methionine sulfoxide reductase-like isoform X2 n=1 Tax=Brachyhypopomus gauderio TaxID=698409 RepID=UPI0040429F2D